MKYQYDKNKLHTIFCDMDGVLCDMEKSYTAMFGVGLEEARSKYTREITEGMWKEFVEADAFRHLEPIAGFEALADTLKCLEKEYYVNVAILSSSSGLETHASVQAGKLAWLANHGIKFPALIVPGAKFKQLYANDRSILIDDYRRNFEQFIDAGGYAIHHHHTTVDETVSAIQQWTTDFCNYK